MHIAGGTMVVWFRRDLRLSDHPALASAVAEASMIVPLFVLDERLLEGPTASTSRTWYLKRSLAELDLALRARGSGLLVVAGRPEVVVPAVARQHDAVLVVASRDVTPYSHRRDSAVSRALEADGRRLALREGLLLVEPERIHTTSGTPFGVFTPFWRALQKAGRRDTQPAPDVIHSPRSMASPSEALSDASAVEPPIDGLPDPGESAAQSRLRRWVQDGLGQYGTARDGLDGAATSHLGPDLHLGSLSPLQVERAVLAGDGDPTPFVRQLAWREFYHHLLFHRRDGSDPALTEAIARMARPEEADPAAVAAWRDGRTGIPTVDAGMRQLLTTGWLSNRARLVAASFLTRHLLIDHRIGERHFMRHLIDGDVANNRGGWQWCAGVGADPQPWFRIFNPVLQGRRFDPEGAWLKRWLPELERVPTRYVHEPWEMPDEIADVAGVRLGRDYPAPIIGLREGRARALAAYREVTGTGGDGESAG